jgi:cyclase
MSRTLLVRLSAAAVLLGGAWIAYTQNQGKQPPKLTLHKVKDDLYEIEGDGGNVAVLVTNEGVLLVDDKYEQDHDGILAAVKSITNQPIRYILSTHYHADHSGGNAKFLPTAEIISTLNARRNILEHKQSNAPPGVEPARVTFTQDVQVFLGGKEVDARYFGRGHTNGDAVIYFPADRTIHTGDLMAGSTPLIDYPGGGSLAEWPATLAAAMTQFDFDTVIPGHGPVTNKAGLTAYRDRIEKEISDVRGMIRQGKSQDEVGKMLMADYGWQAGSLNFQWSLPGMMTELK